MQKNRVSKARKQLKLTPTEKRFKLHLLRCCLQMMMWRKAWMGMQNLLDIISCGWHKTEHGLKPVIMIHPCTSAIKKFGL